MATYKARRQGQRKAQAPTEAGSIWVLKTVVTRICLISVDAFLNKGKKQGQNERGKTERIVKADGKEGRESMRCQGSGTLSHFQSHILVWWN
jgi:hypothetical protein